MELRKCTNCSDQLPATKEFFFSRNISGALRGECRKCHKNKINQKTLARKRLFVERLGGKCSSCGYSHCIAALDFHHTNPKTKEIHLSRILKLNDLVKIEKELDGCILLCANCHREFHNCKVVGDTGLEPVIDAM